MTPVRHAAWLQESIEMGRFGQQTQSLMCPKRGSSSSSSSNTCSSRCSPGTYLFHSLKRKNSVANMFLGIGHLDHGETGEIPVPGSISTMAACNKRDRFGRGQHAQPDKASHFDIIKRPGQEATWATAYRTTLRGATQQEPVNSSQLLTRPGAVVHSIPSHLGHGEAAFFKPST